VAVYLLQFCGYVFCKIFVIISDNVCGNIKVDINGKKGDYAFGKDVFIFDITPKGIISTGTQLEKVFPFEEFCNKSKTSYANGRSCAAWVIYNENMDYLHCDDLSWNSKTKCDKQARLIRRLILVLKRIYLLINQFAYSY